MIGHLWRLRSRSGISLSKAGPSGLILPWNFPLLKIDKTTVGRHTGKVSTPVFSFMRQTLPASSMNCAPMSFHSCGDSTLKKTTPSYLKKQEN